MTIFATLPVDVRRALARAELRRRRAPIGPDLTSPWTPTIRFMSRDALVQLEPILWDARAADADLPLSAANVVRAALTSARERMGASRQAPPPAPPISDWQAWQDHAQVFGGPAATDADLAAVDGLLAALAETCAGAAPS